MRILKHRDSSFSEVIDILVTARELELYVIHLWSGIPICSCKEIALMVTVTH